MTKAIPSEGNAGVRENVAQARELLEKILSFGPQVPEFTNHIQVAGTELMAAKEMVSKHFGLGHQTITITIEEVCEQDQECKRLVERIEQQTGVSAGDRKGFRDILTMLLQNPALITLLLSWFKTT